MADEALPGPVDFVLVEFPTGASTATTADALSDLVDAGIVRLFDLVLLRRSDDGAVEHIDLAAPPDGAGRGFERFAGAQSGLFDDDDVAQAAEAIDAGTTALLVAYENAWAGPFVAAAHGAGGQLVASQRIPAQVLVEALETAESAG